MTTNPMLDLRHDPHADIADDVETGDTGGGTTGGLDFSLRRVWAAAYRNRWALIAAIAICTLLSVLYLIFATPTYEATASVKIEEQPTQVLRSAEKAQADPVDAQRFLQTQLDIIGSRSVALAVARDQRLIGNAAFYEKMGLPADGGAVPNLTARQAAEDHAVGVLMANMKVKLPVDSRIALISFRSPDPVLAARIANSFAESYIRTDLQRRYDASAYAREFIGQQLQDAKQQLERSERSALAYASSARLIDTSNGASGPGDSQSPKSLTVARLVSLNAAYADALARRTQAEQKWRQAQGESIMSLPEVLANPTIQQLVQRRAQAAGDYREQRETRKDEYPTVRQARAELDEIDSQLATVSGNIRSSLRSQYESALRQEQALRQNISGLEQDTLSEQQRDVQLSILRRATDTSRSLYDTLLQRYRELSAEAGVQPNNIQLIDRAEIPTAPVTPRKLLTLLLGVMLGTVLGVAAAFVLEHMNDTVRTGEDVTAKLDLAMLGSVPVSNDADVNAALLDRKSPVSEAYSSIRAALLLSSRSGLPKTLAVTSVQAGEGKTTTSFATATGLARVGKRTVVIDCDLRRPALHKAFGVTNTLGVSEYLSGQVGIDEILRVNDQNDVTIVTSGAIPPNPTELLSGPLLNGLIRQLRERFDVILIDAPPILGLADAVIIGSQVEGTMLVMEAGRNYRGSMRASVARLRKGGVRLIGAIITKQNMRDLGYNYAADYQYQYSS